MMLRNLNLNCIKMVVFCSLSFALVTLICCLYLMSVNGASLTPAGSLKDYLFTIRDVSNDKDYELVMVHTISRHGERTPADTYPNDPYINSTFEPYGWGMLTNVGRMHMFKIGEFLRARYDNFLGPIYTEKSVYAQSTGANRARMSVALMLAGMWPPQGTPLEWNKYLDWQPIPIVSQELDEDDLLLVRIPCPRYTEAIEELLNTTQFKNDLEIYAPMMRELTKLTGKRIRTPDDVQDVYSTLKAEELYNVNLPEWTQRYYPNKMLPVVISSFIINAYTDEMIRLKGGVFLKKIIEDWKLATIGKVSARMNIYGGHDSTVVNIARALGVWEPIEPDYGVTLLVELYRNRDDDDDSSNSQYYVKINLLNSTNEDPLPLSIPDCDSYCPIEKVISLRRNFLPQNWNEECKQHNPNYTPPLQSGP